MGSADSSVLVEIWNRPACQTGAQRLGYLEGEVDLAARTGIDRDDWVQLRCAADQPAVSLLRARRIVRLTYLPGTADGAYDEWRIGSENAIEWDITPTGRFVRVKALGLHMDLTAAGPIAQLTGGIPTYAFLREQSVDAWVDAVVAHLAAKGYGYIAKGTVDFSATESLPLDHWTPAQVMNELERRTRGEWQLRRNGGTNYVLDVVERIGASATPVRFLEGQNLRRIGASENEVDLATEVLPTTTQGATPEGKGISRTAWKISALNGGTKRATIADPTGAGAEMISEDDQFNGQVFVCMRTGRPFAVVDTLLSSQELEFAALGDLAVGDFLERRVDFTTGIERSDYEWNSNVLLPRVTNVATNVLTITSMLNATDPVPTTNWEKGLRLRASPLQHTNTVTSRDAGTRELTLGSSHGGAIQAGDIGFAHTGASEPYTKQTEIFEVESVTDSTHIVVKNRHNYHGNAVFSGTGAVSWNLRIYRPRATLTYIDSSDASANTVTVTDAAGVGIATNDVVEAFVETGGLLATTLPSPLSLALYDKPKVVRYARNDLGGDRNLMAHSNPWFRDWSGGPSTLPDGWIQSHAGTSARIDAATVAGLYGPYVFQYSIATGSNLRSLPIRPQLTAAQPALVARFRIRPYTGWNTSGAMYIDVGVSNDAPTGTPSLLAFTRIIPPSGTSTPGTEVTSGQWAELSVVITDATALSFRALLRHGLRLHVFLNQGSNTGFQLDAVALYNGAVDPEGFIELDPGAALWGKAGEFLTAWRTAPQTITCDIVDLYQADRVRFASKRLQKGGDIIIYSATAGVDTTVRAMSIHTDFRGRVISECTLNTIQQTLSRQLAGAL